MTQDINDISIFDGLPLCERKAVASCFIEKNIKKGKAVHYEGGECASLFFVKSGAMKIYRSSNEGREQIYEMLDSGGTCLCNPGERQWRCSASAEALMDSTLWFLSIENYLWVLKRYPKLVESIGRLFAKRLQRFSNLIEEVTLKNSKKRLIKYLLGHMTVEKKDSALKMNVFSVHVTQEEIAQSLGSVRETMARQIAELKRSGLIAVMRNRIVIRDKKALQKLLD